MSLQLLVTDGKLEVFEIKQMRSNELARIIRLAPKTVKFGGRDLVPAGNLELCFESNENRLGIRGNNFTNMPCGLTERFYKQVQEAYEQLAGGPLKMEEQHLDHSDPSSSGGETTKIYLTPDGKIVRWYEIYGVLHFGPDGCHESKLEDKFYFGKDVVLKLYADVAAEMGEHEPHRINNGTIIF